MKTMAKQRHLSAPPTNIFLPFLWTDPAIPFGVSDHRLLIKEDIHQDPLLIGCATSPLRLIPLPCLAFMCSMSHFVFLGFSADT